MKMSRLYSLGRLPLLALGMVSLAAGVWAGLGKLEWVPNGDFSAFPAQHGPLMAAGFLGTLISLERAVALGRAWGYMGPLLSGVGAAALAAAPSAQIGGILSLAGSLAFVFTSLALMRRQSSAFTVILTLGAACLFAGTAFWVFADWHFRIVLWWIAFLFLTIVGERFELSQFAFASQSAPLKSAAAAFGAAFIAGAALTSADLLIGVRLCGAAMAFFAAWLLRYDVANRNLRQPGLPGFISACLVPGYAWLLVSGLILAWKAPTESGLLYDAALHAVFLGFAVSMIFGHAALILPAITGFALKYRPSFYAHLALLHAGLLVRVAAGVAGSEPGRRWGALLNALAFVLFLANTVRSAILSARSRDQ